MASVDWAAFQKLSKLKQVNDVKMQETLKRRNHAVNLWRKDSRKQYD